MEVIGSDLSYPVGKPVSPLDLSLPSDKLNSSKWEHFAYPPRRASETSAPTANSARQKKEGTQGFITVVFIYIFHDRLGMPWSCQFVFDHLVTTVLKWMPSSSLTDSRTVLKLRWSNEIWEFLWPLWRSLMAIEKTQPPPPPKTRSGAWIALHVPHTVPVPVWSQIWHSPLHPHPSLPITFTTRFKKGGGSNAVSWSLIGSFQASDPWYAWNVSPFPVHSTCQFAGWDMDEMSLGGIHNSATLGCVFYLLSCSIFNSRQRSLSVTSQPRLSLWTTALLNRPINGHNSSSLQGFLIRGERCSLAISSLSEGRGPWPWKLCLLVWWGLPLLLSSLHWGVKYCRLLSDLL